MKKLQKSEKGFTIIEVLIVLAIAGLIMLIVFLAVPALQRNSRNTQRKNDVSSIVGAVNEYTSNNAGTLPPDADTVIQSAKLGYYKDTGGGLGNVQLTATGAQTLDNAAANDRVIIAEKQKCPDPAQGTTLTTVDGSARQIAVLYQIETSGDPLVECESS
ncbi:MAG TPA: type II secretion system protein [Candidatus Saccharimonadales bacterium]|nr:type II secretion system protein [Candidatus Saccharimonadales bacterium]